MDNFDFFKSQKMLRLFHIWYQFLKFFIDYIITDTIKWVITQCHAQQGSQRRQQTNGEGTKKSQSKISCIEEYKHHIKQWHFLFTLLERIWIFNDYATELFVKTSIDVT